MILTNEGVIDWDEVSFKVFWDLRTQTKETGVMEIDAFDLFTKEPEGFKDPWYASLVPQYARLKGDEIARIPGAEFGYKFKTGKCMIGEGF